MKFLKKTDFIIIIVISILALSLLVFYRRANKRKEAVAKIYYKSELVETVDLTKGIDKTFTIPQKPHVVFHQYKNGAIRFEESDCPDKVCIKAGKLEMPGESTACLPNEITLKIEPKDGYQEDDVDIVVGK